MIAFVHIDPVQFGFVAAFGLAAFLAVEVVAGILAWAVDG